MEINFPSQKVIKKKPALSLFKKECRRYFPVYLIILQVFLLLSCESRERFYRPDLPEMISCIGIIDADDTSHYRSYIPDLLDSTNTSRRYITFEKSVQVEYPEVKNDSLREFSFSIYSTEKELFKYSNESTIKNIENLRLPDSILFNSGHRYYLKANEKDSREISAYVIVPEPPEDPELLRVYKEITTISPDQECPVLNNQTTTATIEMSFTSNQIPELYYALLLEGRGVNINLPLYMSGLMDFKIRNANVQGFFAPFYGLKMYHQKCTNGQMKISDTLLPTAYFFDGSKIPGNICNFTLSAQFHDAFSIFDYLVSIKIKLLSIPKELYYFEKSLYTYERTYNDPFAEPIYIGGNIEEGIGIFAICRSTDLLVPLSPPY